MLKLKFPSFLKTRWQSFKSFQLGVLWLAVHFFCHVFDNLVGEVKWTLRHIFNLLLLTFPFLSTFLSQHAELANIFHNSQLLRRENKKMPKHLGVVVFGKEPLRPLDVLWANLKRILFRIRVEDLPENGKAAIRHEPWKDRVDLQALAKVVCCAWIADIPVVSFYDHNGYIKSNHKEFLRQVEIEITQNLWVVSERTKVLPIVKLHNIPLGGSCADMQKSNNNNNNKESGKDTTTSNSPELLNICLFCYEDGKQGLVTTCKEIYKEFLHHSEEEDDVGQKLKQVDELVVDKKINAAIGRQFLVQGEDADPDLMIVLGKVGSTVGFLPWEIRLTEMHWLPCLRLFDGNNFLQSILKYANCERRFGT